MLNISENIKAPYLRIEHLTKKFGNFTALHDVSLDIAEGEFVCFLGPSGCGKTTLLRAVAGLDIQTRGKVWQGGRDISDLPASMRDFGIVFQSYALFPNLNIYKNIAYGLENKKLPRAQIAARVDELLQLVGLGGQGNKYPAQLSGGQQQRVALTRALATSPGLLLLDEPLSALDARVRAHLRHEIKDLQRRLNVTTIMVTHDQEEALTMADRIVLINQGIIEQVGTPRQMYRQPQTLFVADFIGAMNQIACLSGGSGRAKIGALTVACRPHALGENLPGVLTIRPEDLIPKAAPRPKADAEPAGNDKTGAASSSGNSIEAIIRDMEFLGSIWRATLASTSLGDDRLQAEFSVNAVQRMDLAPGKSITVELPPDRITIFPGKQIQSDNQIRSDERIHG